MTEAWPDERRSRPCGRSCRASTPNSPIGGPKARRASGCGIFHTQIRRVTAALDAVRLQIGTQLDEVVAAPGGADDRVRRHRDDDPRCPPDLGVLPLEAEPALRRLVPPFLVAADEFAWDCYTPVRAAVDPAHVAPDEVREPPMVFLNGGWSPFEMSRGIAFDAEVVPDEEVPRQQYRAILDDLPFPVIGLPWYQVRHLPDAVLLGHEVGHTVEDDFRLTDRLESLLRVAFKKGKVGAERRDAWSSWLGETFADVYGTLAGGPAFTGALMDLVAGPPKRIATERADARAWGDYPPASLRVHVALAALAEFRFFGRERGVA